MKAYPTKAALIAALSAAGLEQMNNGAWYVPGRYCTSHGEYERPDYATRRYRDGWALHASYYYYYGTFYAPEDGRLDAESQAYLLTP